MAETGLSPKVEETEEHEEGEISDEEPSPPSVSEEQSASSRVQDDKSVEPAVGTSPASDRDPPLLHRRTSLDDLIEQGGELRAGQARKRTDFYRGRGELDSNLEDDSGALRRNGWGTDDKQWQRRDFPPNGPYGSNLYNFAWAQAVSGRPSFSPGDSPTTEKNSKISSDRLPSGLGGLGTWSVENRKLTREFSRDSESYRRVGKSSDERNDMSPTRENGSKNERGDRGTSERVDTTRRGRVRETWAERPHMVRIRADKFERGITEDEDVEKAEVDSEEDLRKKQPPESHSPNGKSDEVDTRGRSSSEGTVHLQEGKNGKENRDAEDREEGELEEGEIELSSLPARPETPASPCKETTDYSRPSKYSGMKGVDYWPKDKTYTRTVSKSQSRSQTEEYSSLSRSQSRSQIEEYSSRRHRQAKSEDYEKEKRLSAASDLVKNVTVKDAQKSFIDVCSRLHKALKYLGFLHTSRQSVQEDGRLENPPREIANLARQAFAGIRAVYAVRNTASGREQERDKNMFPRLLELANGYCQKLFNPKQIRELEVMMQTIANAGRFVRDDAEKGQYPREHQFLSAAKKSKDNDSKPGDSLGNNVGTIELPNSSEPKASSDKSTAGRILGFADAKQAEEAAAIAAAALAYAQSSAAARASSLFGSSSGSRSSGTSGSGPLSWEWVSGNPPQVQFTDPGLNSVLPNNTALVKYQLWSEGAHLPGKFARDKYAGGFLEAMTHDTLAAASSSHANLKGDLNAPPGYTKPASSYGGLENSWEDLSPPGAGLSSYVPSLTVSVPPVGAKDETFGGKVWPLKPEMRAVPSYQKNRATSMYSADLLPSPTHCNNRVATSLYSVEQLPSPTHEKSMGPMPQYSAEQLPSPTQKNNRATTPAYSVDRLPSPTPDEDEDVSVLPSLPSMETKPDSADTEGMNPSVLLQPEEVGKMPSPTLLGGSIQTLTRSQSLDLPVSLVESNVPKEMSDVLNVPSTARSADDTETAVTSFQLKGTFRSRDPRRRLQSHSLDMTDMVSMDLNSQVGILPNITQEPNGVGNDRNRKRFAIDMIDKEDIVTEKRQKGQSESFSGAIESNRDNLHVLSGSGGWLDDNVVLPFATTEEGPIAMEVDEEDQSLVLEERKGVGGDVKMNGDDRPAVFLDLFNYIGLNKRQKVDLGQQTSESGHRKMKPRDPRRVLLESNVERGDSSSRDLVASVTGVVSVSASKGECGSMTRVTSEPSNRNNTGRTQKSLQGASLPNIAPHFMEKLASLAGMVGSSSLSGSLSQSQHLVQSGGAQMIPGAVFTESAVGTDAENVEGSHAGGDVGAVSSDSISQELPENQNDPTVSTGPRKAKGNPSQWGASQVHPGLEQLLGDLSEDERRSVQLERKRRMEEQDRMFSAGKLCLVLDLDHTLLNSAKFSEIEQEWEQRLRVAETTERNRGGRDGLERRELYRFPHMSMWTKLRPGIWKFLARASQLFELHVYTMGNKVYATEMAKLLDPTGKLFAGRVISKGDDGDGDDILPKSKDLDGVLGMESAVVIIDDSARVWPHHSHNLIVVERYMYFPCSRRQFGLAGPSLLEVGHDERESDGMLASALGVIDRIHQSFFKNQRLREIDVREILAEQQRQVLAGCKVVFSRVFPVGEAEPHRHPLWRTAEQFGAICTIAIDDQVTHVVAIALGTDKVNWALETGRHVVRPAWLEASTILYRRANEREFPVLPQ